MKGKVPIIIIAVCVLGSIAFFISSSGTSERDSESPREVRGVGDISLKCDECEYEWSQRPRAEMLCPKCDAPGYTTASFHCRKCKEEFVGLETQKLGRSKYKYRRAGEEKWTKRAPAKLKCTNCGFESDIHYSNAVNNSPDEEEGRRPRRVD